MVERSVLTRLAGGDCEVVDSAWAGAGAGAGAVDEGASDMVNCGVGLQRMRRKWEKGKGKREKVFGGKEGEIKTRSCLFGIKSWSCCSCMADARRRVGTRKTAGLTWMELANARGLYMHIQRCMYMCAYFLLLGT